jgi:competence protein ComEC
MEKKPLMGAAILFVLGIFLGKKCCFHPIVFATGALLVGILGAALLARDSRKLIVYALIILAGALAVSLRTFPIHPNDLRNVVTNTPILASVIGVVHETPVIPDPQFQIRPPYTSTLLHVKKIIFDSGESRNAYGKVLVKTSGLLSQNVTPMCIVKVHGVLTQPDNPLIPGTFDLRRHLESQGVYYELRVPSSNCWEIVQPPSMFSIYRASQLFRKWASKKLLQGLLPESGDVYSASTPPSDEPIANDVQVAYSILALSLGWKAAISGETKDSYMKSGTMHLFAISGIHIGIIATICIATLRIIGFSRSITAAVAILLIWFYTSAVQFPASAVRAATMTTIVLFGWIIKRPSNLLNSLGASAIIILAIDPLQLFQLGFQLSFGVMLALCVVSPMWGWLPRKILPPDPWIPYFLQKPVQKTLRRSISWILTSLVTSFGAWMGSAPLIAQYFSLCTPITIIANIPMVPLAGLALAAIMASLCFAEISPPLSELFNWSAWLWMWMMDRLSHWFANLPFGHFYVKPPSTFIMLYWYLLLCVIGLGLWKNKRLIVFIACVGVGLLIGALAHQIRAISRWEITALPLSGGRAIVCTGPGFGKGMLIDCGNIRAAQSAVTKYLHRKGINSISTLVLSTGLINQVGGAPVIITNFKPIYVITNFATFQSHPYRQMIQEIQRLVKDLPQTSINAPANLKIDPWTVIHPNKGIRFTRAADNTLVLTGGFFDTRILIIPEIGEKLAETLASKGNEVLSADVLFLGTPKIPHHILENLLAEIRPETIIVMDSTYPVSLQTPPELHELLAKHSRQLYFTSRSGAITMEISRRGYIIRTATPTTFHKHPFSQIHTLPSEDPDTEYNN